MISSTVKERYEKQSNFEASSIMKIEINLSLTFLLYFCIFISEILYTLLNIPRFCCHEIVLLLAANAPNKLSQIFKKNYI